MRDEITLEIIEEHARKHGRKGTAQLMSVLGRKQPMYHALTKSESVKIVLKSAMGRMNELLDKIIEDKCTTEEKHEYNSLKKIFTDWSIELDTYKKHCKKLKGVKKKEKITDEDLNKAADAILGDEEVDDGVQDEGEKAVAKEGEEEVKKEKEEIDFEDLLEKKLHETKSDWGRKLAASEKQIGELSGMVQSLVGVIEAGQQKDVDYDDNIPLSRTELDAYLDKRDNKRMQIKQEYDSKYENGYLKTLGELTSTYDENVTRTIEKTVREDFNIRYSDDPAADAERNFLKAKIALMENAVERKKNPIKGGDKGLPLGGASGSDSDFKSTKVFKLDEHAQNLVDSMKLKPEFVEKALAGEARHSTSEAFAKKGIKA